MTVHFVGAGPGAADLLTVRATRMLATADVVLYPGTYLDPEVLAHVGPQAFLIDTQGLNLDQITEHLVSAARAGKSVVRLASGDMSIYSALAEQTRRLDDASVPWDVTPGVPAWGAAAAVLGREFTVPEVAQSVVLTRVRVRSTPMPEAERLEAFAATGATLVVHLAIRHAQMVADAVQPHLGGDCPVAVVYRASQPDQLVLRTTVAGLADTVAEAGLKQAAVIIIGRALDRDPGSESFLYDPHRVRPGASAEQLDQ